MRAITGPLFQLIDVDSSHMLPEYVMSGESIIHLRVDGGVRRGRVARPAMANDEFRARGQYASNLLHGLYPCDCCQRIAN